MRIHRRNSSSSAAAQSVETAIGRCRSASATSSRRRRFQRLHKLL
uniref:Uncharacterized protein n=1 Tax=Rhizophora mucronata TaxID=61149 RepID=A0A2P2MZB0_RHIMU